MSISPRRSYQKSGAQYKRPRNVDDSLLVNVIGNTIVKPGTEGRPRL